MLTIRKAQLDELARVSMEDFKSRLEHHLRGLRSGAEAEMGDFLDHAIAGAQSFGLRTEREIVRFAAAIFLCYGAAPAKLPKEAQNILLGHGVKPERKLELLEEWLTASGGRTAATR